ncbi:hypothetical protein [Ruegeria atlantica]|uniref:hypothetical protein n=1 Tax=Ruegeria atlantica TaxID=81569 RepID=UPI00071CE28A|nr:hypothetical protein [Ruegeria atlantica]
MFELRVTGQVQICLAEGIAVLIGVHHSGETVQKQVVERAFLFFHIQTDAALVCDCIWQFDLAILGDVVPGQLGVHPISVHRY